MTKPDLTAERLRELCRYDPETGVFWRFATSKIKICQGPASRMIGGINIVTGYMSMGIAKQHFYAHRLAWFYMTGEWPTGEIDHINGVRNDNRWVNLRDVSRKHNAQNMRRALSHNGSGLLGVTKAPIIPKKRNIEKWVATIAVDGRRNYLGIFDTPEEAHAVYLAAKRLHHPGCTI